MPDAAALAIPLGNAARSLARLRAHPQGANEANTKGILIEPVLSALGWDIADPDAVSREWRGDDRGRGNPVDYALFPGPRQAPALLVEAKPLGERLEDITWIGQATGYANTQDVPWCILTDGAHWDVYKAHARGRGTEKRFFRASLDDLPASLDLFRLLCRDALIPPLLEQAWEERELRVKVQAALEADRADLEALARRLHRNQKLKDLDPKQIRRVLRDLLAEIPASQTAFLPNPLPPQTSVPSIQHSTALQTTNQNIPDRHRQASITTSLKPSDHPEAQSTNKLKKNPLKNTVELQRRGLMAVYTKKSLPSEENPYTSIRYYALFPHLKPDTVIAPRSAPLVPGTEHAFRSRYQKKSDL